ncbi:hypothetical protein SynPROS91_01571 [Synechococcus sp. PROS-9-1]|nr:hypothetical protein SynPROS91_01571 [Synechococcus sp. PROS-9-1]
MERAIQPKQELLGDLITNRVLRVKIRLFRSIKAAKKGS